MVLVQDAIKELQIKRLIKKKVERTLCKLEAELKKELQDKDFNEIQINFGKDKEVGKYTIQIDDKQIHFTLEEIAKIILETNKVNKEDIDGYNTTSMKNYHLVKNI